MRTCLIIIGCCLLFVSSFHQIPRQWNPQNYRIQKKSFSLHQYKNIYRDGPRIVGGRDATEGEFPFMVRIQRYPDYPDYPRFCGGSIIGPKHILSSAHCFDPKNGIGKDYRVITGSIHMKEGNIRYAAEVVKHPERDAAILILTEEIHFNNNEKMIRLGTRVPTQKNNVGTIAGWGTTEDYTGQLHKVPQILKTADVPIFKWADCKKTVRTLEVYEFCAGGNGISDSCIYDSGGPFIFEGKLVGIIDRGFRICQAVKKIPGVFLSVPDIKEWIEQYIPPNP